ncbi:MAG: exo-alpha-sialidase [Pirellulaceae bacterium]
MIRHLCLFGFFVAVQAFVGLVAGADDSAVSRREPKFHQRQVLVTADPQSDWRYLAFPALIDRGDEVLVSYKRGRSHAGDPGSTLELLRLDERLEPTGPPAALAALADHILQMGEWVQFPNGDLVNFIDTQVGADRTQRAGLYAVRSTDGGRTFSDPRRVGVVDGIEYGYVFDSVSEGASTWMLAMTFSNLTGGRSVYPRRPHAGSVNVLRSDDSGRSWRLVRDLSHEFGDAPINESALLRLGDGFLVSTRGYDDRQRVHRTDASFRVVQQRDLTDAYSFIGSHIGRPRLFARDGRVYLLGRNWTAGSPRTMQLALFRLDPGTLRVVSYAVLDNADGEPIADGYYAMPVLRGTGDGARLHVITYQGRRGVPPEIVKHEFRWGEVN